METLKLEDLMINDIVLAEAIWYDEETGKELREWHPLRITTARKWDILECYVDSIGEWLDDCDAESIGNLKPMPLTHEILEANGFEETYLDAEYNLVKFGNFMFYKRHPDTSYPAKRYFSSACHCEFEIDFIHKLQDALRVCGLKKLANNFKIK